VPHRVSFYIRSGRLDRLLLSPASRLAQMAGESGINLPVIGRVFIGLVAMLAVSPQLDLPWWSALYLPLAVLSGSFITVSVQLMFACLSFWVVNVNSLMQTMCWINGSSRLRRRMAGVPEQVSEGK